jgi:hypothetical protein
MNVVILVPRRADGGHRDRLWAHCRQIWEDRHDWPIYEGHHDDGPFNRAKAVNRAAELAGEWDVALIIDSDVICAPDSVASAVELAYRTDQMVVAHDERVMLTKQGTEKVLNGYQGSWRERGMHERIWLDSVSCAVAVSRRLWDLAGPMDELFIGWGREDTAFRISCEVETGPIVKVCGETFHLWHPTAPEVAKSNPLRKANEKRHQAYVAARGDRARVRALRGADSEGVDLTETTIPRILHRTVPAETSEQVEAWWERFEELHPGWDCKTYREPIDPAEWPLTGDLFDRCANGAQKAGLIRLEALHRDGGIYVDSDVEPFRSLEPLLHCQAFAAWEDETTAPDAVLGCRPGHPAFELMISKARASIEGGGDAWLSGPGVTTEVLPNRSDVLVLPPGAFYPYSYLQKHKRAEVTPESQPWVFAVHHWHHSWGSEAQKRSIEKRQRT